MFQEVDEVDAQSGAFIFGRKNEPTQPQIMKTRLVMAKAKQCIGLIDSEEKVCLLIETIDDSYRPVTS